MLSRQARSYCLWSHAWLHIATKIHICHWPSPKSYLPAQVSLNFWAPFQCKDCFPSMGISLRKEKTVMTWPPRGCLNIKMSYQYRNPHVKDKTVSRPSKTVSRTVSRLSDLILDMGITISEKDGLYLETGPWCPEKYQKINSVWIYNLFICMFF